MASLENTMIEIKDIVLNNRVQLRKNLTNKIFTERTALKIVQQERKLDKFAEFDEKLKVIEDRIESEVLDEDELVGLEAEKGQLETGLQVWMKVHETRVQEEDLRLEEKELSEDNRLASKLCT